jgi:acetyltransferase-like isoleucine patch superfamily enzyme
MSNAWGRLWMVRARKAFEHPRLAFRTTLGLARGLWCRASCRIRGVRFSAGRNLIVNGRLVIKGPGTVIFGDNVRIGQTVTPWTYSRDAVIRVGSDSYLNGTTFGCQQEITIGPRAILATVSILDTDFHSTHIDRHSPNAPVRVAPVYIGANVWIGARAGVLAGTRIGDNSVVGFGAVCSGDYPANVIVAGNPARVVRAVPGVGADRGDSPEAEAVL